MQKEINILPRNLTNQHDQSLKYGVKLYFQVLVPEHIGNLEHVPILLKSGLIATIERTFMASWDGGKRYLIRLGWFRTIPEAEKEGRAFSQALLLTAISLNIGFKLELGNRTSLEVFDRSTPEWSAGVEVGDPRNPSLVMDELINNCANQIKMDEKLLLSIELYCAAFLDRNQRSSFITLVSAFEPLAEQIDLGPEVSRFIAETLLTLANVKGLKNDIYNSLVGRINNLQRESVNQSLKRLSKKWFPNRKEIHKQIECAYGLRSEWLHNGKLADPNTDIVTLTVKISQILRAIFSLALGVSFKYPIGIEFSHNTE